MRRASLSEAPSALRARLEARRAELEEAILARVYGIGDPSAVPERQYVEGLRGAAAAALDYGLAAIESVNSFAPPPVPPTLVVQARLAARNGVSLDTVLRRYCGGNTIFANLLIEEAEQAELPRAELKPVFQALASSFDRLLAVVGEEHSRESALRSQTGGQRRVDLVRRLLAGEVLDPFQLNYAFDCWHLGIIVTGPSASDAVRCLAGGLDRTLLLVDRPEQTAWAWLGGRRPLARSEREQLLATSSWPAQTSIAIGEPGQGLSGWRLTHRQATAALPIALRGGKRVARYAEAPLLAALLHDDLLASSLRQLYIDPLADGRDGGASAKCTLRAYFEAAGNVSSTAAALGVTRGTVNSRLATVEALIGQPIQAASAAIQAALQLDDFQGSTSRDP
jgi:hypothetical protein